ncbi:MAG TPA: hypothetical protein VHM20_02250 [Gammaproteobacteria bacterium]|jgi:hypothetical protein|nr:hypothetical protein [Gammaproteobacteria bacterium]
MFRFDYLISPISGEGYYPSSLSAISVQENTVSIYLRKNPTAKEKELFQHFLTYYTDSLIPQKKFLEEYVSLDHDLQQAHIRIGKLDTAEFTSFLNNLVTYNKFNSYDPARVELISYSLKDKILKEFNKVFHNGSLIGDYIESNHPYYSKQLLTMPTLKEHVECLTQPNAIGCPIKPKSSPQVSSESMLAAGAPVAATLAVGGLLAYSFYRCFKRKSSYNSYKKSDDKNYNPHYRFPV